MAPVDQKMKNKRFTAKDGNWKKSKNNAQGVKKKRKWVPEHKVYEGSVNEGQGFAFKRKQKVQHEYNKLLRKEKKKNNEPKALYKDEYPEHLRHLYMAEAEKLKNEAWTHRLNRSKLRMKGQETGEEIDDNHDEADADADAEATGGSEQTDNVTGDPEPTAASEKDSLPMSNRMRKKMLKKTSYQKTKEEFESITEKRKKKKEEYIKNNKQREEAIQKYKQKKAETFQMLSKKTKKGQPNLNLQMEYLLQKITQGTGK
ncbi:thyroid transcription factor 1-associated protein 26 homolog [Etheostoma spectabile]|uniref:thyroid transcription factor 1-associated protein 26 homolog n=1 Tax=Etheostoma spectabile TaxID=54343 RepID=UPI0013AF6A5E|nr:thyroid transcription factor 1-associated protein 26 [Etheostoma spectabile]XP_032361242.1 thyroid transcription factor 1-associated protein 26 [Etheostoma spectabile]